MSCSASKNILNFDFNLAFITESIAKVTFALSSHDSAQSQLAFSCVKTHKRKPSSYVFKFGSRELGFPISMGARDTKYDRGIRQEGASCKRSHNNQTFPTRTHSTTPSISSPAFNLGTRASVAWLSSCFTSSHSSSGHPWCSGEKKTARKKGGSLVGDLTMTPQLLGWSTRFDCFEKFTSVKLPPSQKQQLYMIILAQSRLFYHALSHELLEGGVFFAWMDSIFAWMDFYQIMPTDTNCIPNPNPIPHWTRSLEKFCLNGF